ncbi:MAG: hypothetical protein ACYDCL_20350 [Myxococcales bacterium]
MRFPAVRAACLLLAVAAVPLTAEAVTFKMELQQVSMKDSGHHGISKAEQKNPRLLAKRINRKILDRRVLRAAYGAPATLLLPNGTSVVLTPLSYAKGIIKVHVRMLMGGQAGLDLDMKLPERQPIQLPAGPYKNDLLMVGCTASVD